MKRLEVMTNCAVLVVALLAGYVLVRQFIFTPSTQSVITPSLIAAAPSEPASQESQVGAKIQLSGIDFQRNKSTLVMALATYCHFCIDSAGFYRRLGTLKRDGKIHANLVAVFPQDKEQASAFTSRFHLLPDQVISSPLEGIGVSDTPTLLLIGSDGKLKQKWVGQLSAEQQETVVRTLGE